MFNVLDEFMHTSVAVVVAVCFKKYAYKMYFIHIQILFCLI